MSKWKKYLMIAFLGVCMSVGLSACNGCKNEEEEETPAVTHEMRLDVEKLLMTLGETDVLIATFTKADDATLSFTSADESVVTVDDYGRLTAVGVGTTQVTATYGTATSVCEITVGTGGMIPVLQMNGTVGGVVKTSVDSFVDLSGTVMFNGKTYDDVTLTYTLSDTDFGSITDGAFYPTKTGAVEIYVTGSWRGVTGESLTSVLSVTVVEGVDFYVNSGTSALTLYTQSQDITPFVVTAKANGEDIPYAVEIVSGAEYIDLDETAGTIASTGKIGESLIVVSTSASGEDYKLEINVTIDQTIYRYQPLVADFSAIHGDTQTGKRLASILGGTPIEAYDKNGNALDVRNGKVYGVEYSKTGKFQTTITVCSAELGYEMDIEGYAGIFNSADDFAAWNTNVRYAGNNQFVAVDESAPMQIWDGYYIVTNNIDARTYKHKASGVNLTGIGLQNNANIYGLTGVFDGQGYTIKGMTVGQYGLFGYINGGVVQNVAFTDVAFESIGNVATFASWSRDAVFTDVYVQLKEQTITTTAATVAMGVNNCSVNNCIFDSSATNFTNGKPGVAASKGTRYGNLFGRYTEVENASATQTKYFGVYTISAQFACYSQTSQTVTVTNEETGEVTETYKEYTEVYVTAENVTFQPVRPNNKTEKDWIMNAYTLKGVNQYATQAEMDAAANSYAAFNVRYWDVSGASPVWKSLNGTFLPADTYVGDFDADWL